MHLLKQSTAASVVVGPVLDATGAAYASAVIGDFTLVKNGTSAALASAATATHDGNGHYIIAMTTGNTDTLGRAAIYCNKATYTMSIARFSVLAGTTFDALITNAAGAANGLFRFGDVLATVTNVTNDVGITQAGADKAWSTTTRTITGSVTVSTNNDKTNYTLASSGLNNVVIESGCDARQAIAIIAAAVAGASTGVDTGSPIFKGLGVATTRISATASAGNRSSVVLTLP